MGNWVLWTLDFAAQRYSSIASLSDGQSTASYALDVDPSTKWAPALTTATFHFDNTFTPYAIGLANHNVKGATLSLKKRATGGAWTELESFTINTTHDVLLKIASPASHDEWKLDFSGASSNIEIGAISLLADYGYNSAGTLQTGQGYQRIELSAGGPVWPYVRNVLPGFVAIPTAGGGETVQKIGSPQREFQLNIQYPSMTDGAGSWFRIEKSYRGDHQTYGNPGWRNAVWVTDDTWDNSSDFRAYYCRPVGPLGAQIVYAGGRVQGQINLRELSRGV